MCRKEITNRRRACLATGVSKLAVVFIMGLVTISVGRTQTLTVVHAFCSMPGCTDGAYPYAGVVQDAAGNLYGTAQAGGSFNSGVVFEVNTSGTESVLYSFTGRTDGSGPAAALIRDTAGNLYGTTAYGGDLSCNGGNGCGVVFMIDTTGKERVLYTFQGQPDGSLPLGGLIRDSAGNLYGTTSHGGSSTSCQTGCGTIFRVSNTGQETVLHSFSNSAADGVYPYYTKLLVDKNSNLYGITSEGGSSNQGVVYELSKAGSFMILHSFAGGTTDGCTPYGTPVIDGGGNLYGTTEYCGSNNFGTVWKVSSNGAETILHNFVGYPSDGAYPSGGMVQDPKGNLYGTTQQGASSVGTVYRLSTTGTLTLLHSFSSASEGGDPYGDLSVNLTKRTLYGTNSLFGSGGAGTLWSLK